MSSRQDQIGALPEGLLSLLKQAEDFTQRLLKSQQQILEQDNHEQAKEYQKQVLQRARQRSTKREEDDSTAEVRVSKRKSMKKERDSIEQSGPPEPALDTQYLCQPKCLSFGKLQKH